MSPRGLYGTIDSNINDIETKTEQKDHLKEKEPILSYES
jgi:hypothetical protein